MMENWICPKEFERQKPINHYMRESDTQNDSALGLKNLHILYRKSFIISKPSDVMLHITADDYYMLYINGIFITQGPATAYHFCQNVNSIDITPYLKTGENVIGIHCLYNGYINRIYNSGDMRTGIYAKAVSQEDVLFVTDSSWKYLRDLSFTETNQTVGYNTQSMENRNMNYYPHGWNDVGFDDCSWENACIKIDDDHTCRAQITPNVTCENIMFKTVTHLEDGSFLLDFGKEIVGQCKIDVCGKKDSKITLMFAEELDCYGNARYRMRCSCDYIETVVLSGKQDKIINFEYKGFRYIQVKAEDSQNVKPECFSVLKRYYPVKNLCKLKSSEKLLQDIWNICVNTAIISAQEVYVDCPTREKGQYLGDMLVTALTHSYVTGDTTLYKKALYDFAATQFINKGLMAVAPGAFMQEIADFSLLYPLQLLHYYNLSGDIQTLTELLPVCEGIVDHFAQFAREDGLLDGVTDKWNLVDWPDNLRDNYDFELTQPIGKGVHNVINAHYYGAQKAVNELRGILKLEARYDTGKLLQAFQRVFYREKTGLFADSEISQHCNFHSNVLPLYYGMFENSDCAVNYIMKRGLCCGVFFSYFVLKGLANAGRYYEVYSLLTNDSVHSWKNMLNEGATSTFEAWGKEQKWNTSLCHPWGTVPVIVIIEDLLGYRFEAGILKIAEPHLPQDVTITVKGGLIDR